MYTDDFIAGTILLALVGVFIWLAVGFAGSSFELRQMKQAYGNQYCYPACKSEYRVDFTIVDNKYKLSCSCIVPTVE